jgi:clan AA aspartic protease (TIGR02281 family)
MDTTLSFMAILCAALGFSASASAEVAPANISGSWQIETPQNGPSPRCVFRQEGNNLTGSCTGPKAEGTITGTIIGDQVRWRWQWVTYTGNAAAAFDFIGTLGLDNTITGMLERRETGFSLNFRANALSVARRENNSGPSTSTAPNQNPSSQTRVSLKKFGGTFVVPVEINGAITLDFTIDSGAADVSVPADVFSTLMRTGTIRDTDIIGKQTYVLADGSKSQSDTFTIRLLKVGDIIIENVEGSVLPEQGSPLLGQSFLERVKSWSIDNTKHVLLLEPQ